MVVTDVASAPPGPAQARSRTSVAEEVAARRAARILDPRTARVLEDEPGQLVRIAGHLDVHSVPDVRAALHRTVDLGSGDLVVDVAEAIVGDATGLGVLVGAHRRAQRRGRRLLLTGVTLPTLRLLRVTKLHRVLQMCDTVAGEESAGPSRVPTPADVQAERLRRARAIARAAGRSGAGDGTDPGVRADPDQNSRALGSSMPRRAS